MANNSSGQANSGSGGSQQAASGNSSGGSSGQQDQTFVQQAMQSGQAEIQMGQLAEQQAANPAVKEFGRWMVTDHTMANQELQEAVQQSGNSQLSAQNSSSPDQQQQQEMSKLKGMHGSQFDSAYLQNQVQDHQKDIQLFQKEQQSGQSQQLKDYAQETLPVLQAHLQQAQDLQNANLSAMSSKGGSSASASSSGEGNQAVGAQQSATSRSEGPTAAGNAEVRRLNEQELRKIQKRQ